MDIEIEINEDGTMLINRQGSEHNAELLELLEGINASNISSLEDFLSSSDVDLLFGDEILCG